MAASVLGKRSRQTVELEDVELPLPSRKRATRSSAPRIFEDASESLNVSKSTALNDPPRKSILSQSRTVKTKRNCNSKTAVEHGILKSDVETTFQDENIPPTVTPSATRFKDALSILPSTPKHRVRLTGGLLTPRTPSSTSSPKQRHQSVFTAARQLFTQASNPTKLVGRDVERQQLHAFVSGAIKSRKGGCTYVSGPPGTGKSALAQEVLQQYEVQKQVKVATVNCVSLRTSSDVYSKLIEDLTQEANTSKALAKQHLAKLLTGGQKSTIYVVMLDELDSLLDGDSEVLYSLFEWSMHASSSLALIGIANALDLTDRFLPRLKSRGLKPQLLPFLPYTAQQISAIITDKLRSLLPSDTSTAADFVPFMQPAAIQLCGKKIASQTGDLRKAFNLVRRSIDQVEKETTSKQGITSPTKQPLGEVTNAVKATLPTEEYKPLLTSETAPRATIAHIARLASSIFNNGTLSRLSGLNLQQKAVLCSLISKETRKTERNPFVTPSKSANRLPTVKDLFAIYSMLCKRDDGLLQPLKDTEFRDVIESLETLGLIHESKARASSLLSPAGTPSKTGRNSDQKQIVSAVSEKEMRDSLAGAGADLLRRLLDES